MVAWANTGENPNVYLANDDRTVWITNGGIAPAAGAAAYGACDADVALPSGGKVAVCVQLLAVDDSDGTTPLLSRSGRLGFANDDWANFDAVTNAAVLGNAADSWALSGGQDPSDIRDEGSTTFSGAIAVGNGEYVVLLVDVDASKAWAAAAVGGSPGSLTVVSSGDPAAGTTPTWTLHGTGLRVAFSSGGNSLRVVGATLLTSEEFDALGITLPSGFSYATDGASAPDVPTSVAIALDTGTTVDVTWDAGSGDSIELEIRSSLGAFTGTPTHTGLTDDGSHPVDVGGAGTWYAKARRVTSSVASDWSSAASTTIGAMVLTVKNGGTKVAPCGVVATIWHSTPPDGLTMARTTAYWQWSRDGVVQGTEADSLTLDIAIEDETGCDIEIECFWYAADGTALGYGVETITVEPAPTYDAVRYVDPTIGSDSNSGLTAAAPKASFGGVFATFDMTADHERLVVCGGSGVTDEGAGVGELNLGYANGSLVIRGNGEVAVGAAITCQQHGSTTDPSRHLRLAMVNLPIAQQIDGGANGAFEMRFYGGSHESRERGYDVLWTAPYASGNPNGSTTGIGFVKLGYVGSSDDWTSPTMDWPGVGDAVLHIASIDCGSPQLYGDMEYCGVRADYIGDSSNHEIRTPRFHAFVFRPLSGSRCQFGLPGTTGDHAFKFPARAADALNALGSAGGRLDSFGACILDCDFPQQSIGGTSVSPIAIGAQNNTKREFARGLRVVRPDESVPDGQTPGGNRALLIAYASSDDVAIYDARIRYPRATLLKVSLSRTGAAAAEPGDPALFVHRYAVFGASMFFEDDGPTIVDPSTADVDLTGHAYHFVLRDIAAKCTDPASIGIRLRGGGATITCDADGIVTDAAVFAEDDGEAMTLAEFAAAYGGNARSAHVDPEFTDAEAGDFSFDGTSPLYEAAGIEGLAVDVLGQPRTAPRDIGAIEESTESSGLTAPTSLAGVQVSRTAVVTLTYDAAPEGATGIQARHRYGSADWSGWADLGTPDGSSDMTAAAVQTGTLSVQARFTGDGDPSPAAAASVAMLEPAPSAPAAPSLAQVGPSTVARVTIATVARADDGYLVERSTTGAFGGEETEVGTLEPGDLTIDDDIGAFDVERWYRATALNATLGDSSPGTAASITLVAPELDAPTDLAVVASGLVGAATWTDNSEGLAAYVLWRRQEGDVEWAPFSIPPTEAGAEEAEIAVPSAGTWEIAVAIEGDLDESNWSIVSVSFVAPPPPPASVAIAGTTISGRAILAQWTIPETEVPIAYALVEWTGEIDSTPIDGGAWQYGGMQLANILGLLFVVPEGATSIRFRITFFRLNELNRLVGGEPLEGDATYGVSPEPEIVP